MVEEVGRGRDWRRADGDEEAATGEDEGAATTTAAAEEGGAENGRTAGCCCLRRWKGGKKWRSMLPSGDGDPPGGSAATGRVEALDLNLLCYHVTNEKGRMDKLY